MSSVSTNTTYDVRGEIALLGTVVLAMADLAAILAGLVLVISEGSVQCCEFAELVALKLVLTFRDGGGLRDVSRVS